MQEVEGESSQVAEPVALFVLEHSAVVVPSVQVVLRALCSACSCQRRPVMGVRGCLVSLLCVRDDSDQSMPAESHCNMQCVVWKKN